jgi:hypothetical protein
LSICSHLVADKVRESKGSEIMILMIFRFGLPKMKIHLK